MFNGGIYDYNGSGTGTINMGGGTVIVGSIIADSFNIGGNPFVYYPTNMQATNDIGLWYGFLNQWTEINGM